MWIPKGPELFYSMMRVKKKSGIIIFVNILLSHFSICLFAEEQPLQMTLDCYCCVQLCNLQTCQCAGVWFTWQQDSQLQQHLPDTHSGGPAAHIETLLTEPLHQLHTHIASPVKTHICNRVTRTSIFKASILPQKCLSFLHVGVRLHVCGSAVMLKSIYL